MNENKDFEQKLRAEAQFQIKDSGERRNFDTGAKRDVDYDKPRFDLIPMTVIRQVIAHYSPSNMYTQTTANIDANTKARMWQLGLTWGETVDSNLLIQLIWICLNIIRVQEKDTLLPMDDELDYDGLHLISPMTYFRLAQHYGGGAKKYKPWNWSKGMPLSVFHASLMRHIFAVIQDQDDEDHLSAIFFNAAAILHFRIIGREDVDDVTLRLDEWANNACD